jgi:hypothetical protein
MDLSQKLRDIAHSDTPSAEGRFPIRVVFETKAGKVEDP